MKFVVFLGDGMADLPIAELNGKTPLEAAEHPTMDFLAQNGKMGLAKTVPAGMPAGSDVANLSVLGYDPAKYYSGRSPFEALSMGIELNPEDVTYRCNLVRLSEESRLEDATMIDYSSGEIETDDARVNIEALQQVVNRDGVELYPGISYRHCLVLRNADSGGTQTPPHDITNQPISDKLPKGTNAELLLEITKKSYQMLRDLPVNQERARQGKNATNAAWMWGEGRKPNLPSFEGKYGCKGGMISAVDLLHGIAKSAGMTSIPVENITGTYHTDFKAKGAATIEALKKGLDFVYIHVEAADECGHHGELKEKIWSIEQIDKLIVRPVLDYLMTCGEDFAVLLTPDHPTPLSLLTHTSDPVPFVLYRREDGTAKESSVRYTEADAKATGVYEPNGYTLMDQLLLKRD